MGAAQDHDKARAEWERAYDDAMQWRDWQTCEQMTKEREQAEWYTPEVDHPHEVPEGEECPTCKRRVPRAKKPTSPKTKVVSLRVPIDDAETFEELLEAAAENGGLRSKGHWKFWTVHRGLVLLLQEPYNDGA